MYISKQSIKENFNNKNNGQLQKREGQLKGKTIEHHNKRLTMAQLA